MGVRQGGTVLEAALERDHRKPDPHVTACIVARTAGAHRARTAWHRLPRLGLALAAALALLAAAGGMRRVLGGDGVPPLPVDIESPTGEIKGRALVYPNYIELNDADNRPRGAIGVLIAEGKARLFLVKANSERSLIGWAQEYRLFDAQDKLVGYYYWTPIWSYVYDPKMTKIGQARCIAYQGVCAAGVAGYLLGLY